MAVPVNRHVSMTNDVRVKHVLRTDFSGGLNLSVPAEMLASNEMSEALNIEYSSDTGGAAVRGGAMKLFTLPALLDDLVDLPGLGTLIHTSSGRLFHFREMLLLEPSLAEDAASDCGAPPYHTTIWDEGDVVFVGTGGADGKLCKFNGRGVRASISAVVTEGAPVNPRCLFVWFGRMGCVEGDSTLRFSGIGDMSQWTEDVNDTMAAQHVEVGYKDGMQITAVIPLSRDLIIFKCPDGDTKHGIIYRLTGDWPDIYVLEVARNTGTFSQRSVQNVGNDLFYLSEEGLCSLSTVTSYGDVKTAWPDAKIAKVMKKELRCDAELINLRARGQLWVWPTKNAVEEKLARSVWVMHYEKGGAWTKFEFVETLGGLTGDFLGVGCGVLSLYEWVQTDEMQDGRRIPIRAKIGLGVLLGKLQTLAKFAVAAFHSHAQNAPYLCIGPKLRIPLQNGGVEDDVAFLDEDVAFLDDDPLVMGAGSLSTTRKRFLVRDWSIPVSVEIEGGGFLLSSVGLETVEV
jgi:hypothetical protein